MALTLCLNLNSIKCRIKKRQIVLNCTCATATATFKQWRHQNEQDSSKLQADCFSLPVILVSEGPDSWGAWHPVTAATLSIMHEPLSVPLSFTYTHIHSNSLLTCVHVIFLEFSRQNDSHFFLSPTQTNSNTKLRNTTQNSEKHTIAKGKLTMTWSFSSKSKDHSDVI